MMSFGAKRVKLSHFKDEFAACDTWLSTAERKNQSRKVIKKQQSGSRCSKDVLPSLQLLKNHSHVVNTISPATKQTSLHNFFSPISTRAKDNDFDEPAVENTVHKLGDVHQHACMLEVNCNENKQCVASVYTDNTTTVSAKFSDDDHVSGCRDELTAINTEASAQISCPANMCDVVYSCQMNGSVKQNETLLDTRMSQNPSLDLLHSLQNTSISLCDSFCGSDSDLLSHSQGPQLTNTQKVNIFAMELDMMKAPVSAHDSENSF